MERSAEQKKNQGNEEFKHGNYAAAIRYYTEAIGKSHPSLTYYRDLT